MPARRHAPIATAWLVPSLLVTGCDGAPAPDAALAIDVSVEVRADVPTVATLRWTTSEPKFSYVEYGLEAVDEVVSASETYPATDHELLVVGLRADSTYVARVLAFTPGSEITFAQFTITTGSLDPALPTLTSTGEAGSGGGFLVTTGVGTSWGPMILDDTGHIVWWHLETRGFATTRAWLSHDGTAVYYNAMHDAAGNMRTAADGEIVRVPLDGSAATSIPVPYLSHDFLELPDGTLACIVLAEQEVDGAPVIGNAIVEVSTDGTSREVWNSFDHFDPRTTTRTDDSLDDWTHANAIDYDEADDAWLLSLRNFGSILKIDRASGEVLWGVSGTADTFAFDDPAARFRVQHQFELRDGHLLVFDNGDASRRYSRVVDLTLDEAAQTATVASIYEPDEFVYILGDVQRLDDGSLFMVLGTSGELRRVDAAGQPLWGLTADLGHGFGYAGRILGL